MKKYLFTGFITLLPLALTLLIINYVFNVLTEPFVGIVESIFLTYKEKFGFIKHQTLILLVSRLIALIFLFLLILFLGVLGQKLFARLSDKLFLHIPIFKSIYRVVQDVTNAVFSQKEKTFKCTVLIPFPFPETHAIGFVTGSVPPKIKKVLSDLDVAVFVPTSPHPISGFILLTPKKQALDVDITVEEGFKFLLSCGAFHPGETEKNLPL